MKGIYNMNTTQKIEYKKLFSDTHTSISKEDMLTIITGVLDSCIKLSEWNEKWQFVNEEESIIPFDAGRIQGVIEMIFEQKIESMSRDDNNIYIKFK